MSRKNGYDVCYFILTSSDSVTYLIKSIIDGRGDDRGGRRVRDRHVDRANDLHGPSCRSLPNCHSHNRDMFLSHSHSMDSHSHNKDSSSRTRRSHPSHSDHGDPSDRGDLRHDGRGDPHHGGRDGLRQLNPLT